MHGGYSRWMQLFSKLYNQIHVFFNLKNNPWQFIKMSKLQSFSCPIENFEIYDLNTWLQMVYRSKLAQSLWMIFNPQ